MTRPTRSLVIIRSTESGSDMVYVGIIPSTRAQGARDRTTHIDGDRRLRGMDQALEHATFTMI